VDREQLRGALRAVDPTLAALEREPDVQADRVVERRERATGPVR